MLDSLMDGIKGQVVDTLKEKTGLDAGQAEQAVPLAKDSIVEGLTGAVSGGDLSGVMSMFSGGGSGGGMMENMVYKGIANNFINKLTSQIGIPASMASTVSSFALPMIMDKIKGGASNDSGEVDQAGLMSMLGGGGGLADGLKDQAANMLKDKLGGLGGLAGGLFGK